MQRMIIEEQRIAAHGFAPDDLGIVLFHAGRRVSRSAQGAAADGVHRNLKRAKLAARNFRTERKGVIADAELRRKRELQFIQGLPQRAVPGPVRSRVPCRMRACPLQELPCFQDIGFVAARGGIVTMEPAMDPDFLSPHLRKTLQPSQMASGIDEPGEWNPQALRERPECIDLPR